MPNQRAPGQKLIAIPVSEEFLAAVDDSLPLVGYSDRSSFVRDAIVEKLKSDGHPIPASLALAPSRASKGGRGSKPRPTEDQPASPRVKGVSKRVSDAALAGSQAALKIIKRTAR